MKKSLGSIKHVPRLDKVLVKAIQAGGELREAVWDFIFYHWMDYFIGTIRRHDGTDDDAREMLAEVLEPVERALCRKHFRYDAPLQGYMNRAILYCWFRYAAKLHHRPPRENRGFADLDNEFKDLFDPDIPRENIGHASILSATDTVFNDPFFEECFQKALAALDKNNKRQHDFWIEAKVDGQSLQQIADKYGLELRTIKNAITEANAFLRNWYNLHPECLN